MHFLEICGQTNDPADIKKFCRVYVWWDLRMILMNVLWQTKTVLLIPLRTVENEQPVADWTEGIVLLLMLQILLFFSTSNPQLNLLFPLKSSVKQDYITSHRPEHKTHSCVPNKSEIKTRNDRVMDQQMFSFRVVSVDLKTRPASAMWAKDHLQHHHPPLQEISDAHSREDSADGFWCWILQRPNLLDWICHKELEKRPVPLQKAPSSVAEECSLSFCRISRTQSAHILLPPGSHERRKLVNITWACRICRMLTFRWSPANMSKN